MPESLDIALKIVHLLETFIERKIQLSDASLRSFANSLEMTELKKNDLFCREGQVARYISYVHKGLIRQYYYKKQKDVTEHFAADDDMFICIESFFKQEPSHLTVETLEPTILYSFSYQRIEKLAAENHEINNMYRIMLEACLILSQRKADSIRYETAHERYDRLVREQPLVVKRAPLQYIASYLLMTPESLSRIRSGQL